MEEAGSSAALAVSVMFGTSDAAAEAPGRLTDREVERTTAWLEQFAAAFRLALKDALEESRFAGTGAVDDISACMRACERATERREEAADDERREPTAATEVLDRGLAIDSCMLRQALPRVDEALSKYARPMPDSR